MKVLSIACVVCLISLLTSCDGDEGTSVATSTKLTSATLGTSRSTALTTSCSRRATVACITPTAVTGKAYYAGMIVGNPSGLSLGPILGDVKDPSTATSFATTELSDFDFSQGIATTGNVSLGGPVAYPADADSIVQNAHVYFGWMDTTFVLDAADGVLAAIRGTHTIRLVYADIDGTEYQKGDYLYSSDATTFYWCTNAGCDQSTRPTSGTLQNSSVSGFSHTGGGNPTIPSFFANLTTGHAETKVFESELLDTTKTWTFTVDFVMTNGVNFSSNPTGISTIPDLVNAFDLPADPSDSATGFTANITITDQDGNASGAS